MTIETETAIIQCFDNVLPPVADDQTSAAFHAYEDMRRQRDSARRFAVAFEQEASDAQSRIANACALVDAHLQQCICGQIDGYRCIWHSLDDALRGA